MSSIHRAAMTGFTFIEMMVVVAIVATLAVFALPEMSNMVKNQRLKTTSLDIFASLQLARSEAIKRNANTVLMAAKAGGWQAGWDVCVDADADGACAAGEVLMTQDPIHTSITVTGPAASIIYARDGRLPTGALAASFTLKAGANNSVSAMRCVDVDLSGRPRTRADTNGVDSDGCN